MKPSVLHIYKDYYPPVVGGIEKTINLMCEGVKDDYEVRVLIASRGVRLSAHRYECNGVKIYESPSLGRMSSAPVCPAFPLLLKKLKSDILHFHFPNPTGEISYLLARPRGKVVVTYHSDIVRQKRALRFYRPWIHRFLRLADIILPTSPNYIEHSEFLQQYKDKCEVMPLGIDLNQFKLTERVKEESAKIRKSISRPIVLFIGVLRYYKGLKFLIEAMTSVPACLIIIGSGPEETSLRQLCARLGVNDKVVFTGEVSDEEKVCYLYASDIFCLPSHLPSEAYGISQIEAMACGVPVVSTALDTGVPFVNKDGESGIIVPPANPRALADAINSLLADEPRRLRLGKQAQQRAHRLFDARQMISHLKQIYHTLLTKS
ncbi:glycosyltransferase [Candidatus Sumerlaeota bacterium]|nr:glycosyltransferase [Candidatus Sumerlaeota bacterium]